MPLNAVVSDINAVDEALRGFYKQDNGKYVLDVAAADGFALENTSGLKSALSSERKLREEFENKLKPYDGLDAAAARKALEALQAYGDMTPDQAKEAVETAKRLSAIDPEKEADKRAAQLVKDRETQLTGVFNQQLADLTSKLETSQKAADGLKGQLQTLMVDNVIKDELAKLNPLDDARDAIELLAKQAIRPKEVDGKVVVEVVDEKGLARINTDLSPVTVSQLLAELREKRPSLFKPDQINGVGLKPNSGVTGHQGPNPWAKDTWNMTQQMLLTNTKPELAKQLKAQAGVA